eukprot:UN33688
MLDHEKENEIGVQFKCAEPTGVQKTFSQERKRNDIVSLVNSKDQIVYKGWLVVYAKQTIRYCQLKHNGYLFQYENEKDSQPTDILHFNTDKRITVNYFENDNNFFNVKDSKGKIWLFQSFSDAKNWCLNFNSLHTINMEVCKKAELSSTQKTLIENILREEPDCLKDIELFQILLKSRGLSNQYLVEKSGCSLCSMY